MTVPPKTCSTQTEPFHITATSPWAARPLLRIHSESLAPRATAVAGPELNIVKLLVPFQSQSWFCAVVTQASPLEATAIEVPAPATAFQALFAQKEAW
ncbi:MAG: hypothetical protein ACRDJU_04965 [Actinomycetota bacterium]